MDTTASFVRGATPTITVTVDHDLSGLHVVVALRGTGAYVERVVEPVTSDGGCTLALTLTQEESLAFFPGRVTVEVERHSERPRHHRRAPAPTAARRCGPWPPRRTTGTCGPSWWCPNCGHRIWEHRVIPRRTNEQGK